MVDVAIAVEHGAAHRERRENAPACATALKRKSTAAFLMTLPLILLIALLVIHLASEFRCIWRCCNKSMQRSSASGNFELLLKRETFLVCWLVAREFSPSLGGRLQGADRLHCRALRSTTFPPRG